MMQNMKLLVVGSINMDIFTYVKNHPKPGETIKSDKVLYSSGGKGANQAAAASLSGADVYMLGAVGNDAFREPLIKSLKENNVSIDYVMEKPSNSGMAFITVDGNGENHIVLSEGANGLIEKEDIKNVLVNSILPAAILVQNEIAWEATKHAMEMGKKHNITVYYNAAPAQKISDEFFSLIDVLIINETEASTLTGTDIKSNDELNIVLDKLISKGIEEVIITLGNKGSLYGNKAGYRFITPAYKVKTVDTTAAGDTFVGAFLTKRLQGGNIKSAIEFATAASAITVTRAGAQIAIPNEIEIQNFLRQNKLT